MSVDAGMRLQLLIRLRFSIPMHLHGDRVNHCVHNVSLENIREIEKQSEHTRPQCHSAQHKCSTTRKHKASVKLFSVPTAQSLPPQSDDPHYLHLMIQRSQSPEESFIVGYLQPPLYDYHIGRH